MGVVKGNQWSVYKNQNATRDLTYTKLLQRGKDIYFGNSKYGADKILGGAFIFAAIFGCRVSEMSQKHVLKKIIPELSEFPEYNPITTISYGPRVENVWLENIGDDEYLVAVFPRRRKGKADVSKILEDHQRKSEERLKLLDENLDSEKRLIEEDKIKKKYLIDAIKVIISKIESLPPTRVEVLISHKGIQTKDYPLLELLDEYIHNYLPKLYNLNIEDKNSKQYLEFQKKFLFPVSMSVLESRLRKYYPDMSWHVIRRLKVKYLQTEYNFSNNDLMEFFKWTSDRMPSHYNTSNTNDIRNRYAQRMEDLQLDKEIEQQFSAPVKYQVVEDEDFGLSEEQIETEKLERERKESERENTFVVDSVPDSENNFSNDWDAQQSQVFESSFENDDDDDEFDDGEEED